MICEIIYKGYYTHVNYDAEDQIYYGKIEGIRDIVTFECNTINEVVHKFHEAVDDYLSFCKDLGQEPDKPSNSR